MVMYEDLIKVGPKDSSELFPEPDQSLSAKGVIV